MAQWVKLLGPIKTDDVNSVSEFYKVEENFWFPQVILGILCSAYVCPNIDKRTCNHLQK